MRIAHVSTFPPLKCGIAFFAADLVKSLRAAENARYSLHYGNGAAPDAVAHANVGSIREVVALAKAISDSDCDVVGIQHEFGIWGGTSGENLLPFLDELTKPILSVLHTTFPPGARVDLQRQLLKRLIEQSARVVLLTQEAKQTTEILIGRPIDHAVVIPHGVPRFPYHEPSPLRVNGSRAPLRLITPGFFRENKGFEVALRALARLRSKGYDVTYLLAGGAQDQLLGQTTYRQKVVRLVDDLGLGDVVACDTRLLSVSEQVAAIQGCHLGVFAYQDPAQSSSGTVPLVMSAGRPVLCTPFEYGRAKNREGHAAILADGFTPEDVSDAIERFLVEGQYLDLAKEAYQTTSSWAWPKVGARFEVEFRNAFDRSIQALNGERPPTAPAQATSTPAGREFRAFG
jgi:glycosyltransferase involved in cell wall biosynthesis